MAEFKLYLCIMCCLLLVSMCIDRQGTKISLTKATPDVKLLEIQDGASDGFNDELINSYANEEKSSETAKVEQSKDCSIAVRRKRSKIKFMHKAAKKGVVALKRLVVTRMLLKDATLIQKNLYRKSGGSKRALQDMDRVRPTNTRTPGNGNEQFTKSVDVADKRIRLEVNGPYAVITMCPKTAVKQGDCLHISYI